MLSQNYGKRNDEIKEFFHQNGIEYHGESLRDIHFGNAWVTDQVKTFAIYALGEDAEKTVYLKIFEKYGAISSSIKRNPEPSARRKCCARWKHSAKDEEIMLNVIKEILHVTSEKKEY